ncbi:prolyl oligopeptidase family serine peptidase [Streptomyces sp. NBC_01231]|nr:prolyl oligopeptidase family serine peptidase [Streptomyces sp. NBC_01231]
MTSDAYLHQEAQRWKSYRAELISLRRALKAEFATHGGIQHTAPLAVIACENVRFVLVLPAGASLPRLQKESADDWARATTVLDFAQEPTAGPEFLIGGVSVSPDGTKVAYTVDGDGSDRHAVRVHDLVTGHLATPALGAGPSLTWDTVSGRLLYTEVDDTLRPMRVWATDGSVATMVYETGVGYLDVAASSDGGTVFVSQERHGTRSVHCYHPQTNSLRGLWSAKVGERVHADAAGGRIVLLRTGNGPDALLAESDEGEQWRILATAPPEATWDEFTLTDTAALLVERRGGGQHLIAVEWASATAAAPVDFPEVAPSADATEAAASVAIVPSVRRPGDPVDVVRGTWRSPDTWFRTAADERSARLHPSAASTAAQADIDVVSLSVRSEDGARVPLTVLRPAGQSGALPTVLFAYGAYGMPVDPAYSPFRNSLLSRGMAFAIAHVRGGGDLGPQWHEAARGVHKHRAVEDYLACARLLLDQGRTSPGALAARARSAGAAIVGAALNRSPELFAAAVFEAPFLDCLATLSDPEAPLTQVEWDEWGNPLADSEARAALRALSPVDNVRRGPYPSLLLTAGTADSRVQLHEPARFAQQVRAKSTSGLPVLLKVDETGHLGHSDVDEDYDDEADVLAFLIDRLGVPHHPSHPVTLHISKDLDQS